MADAGKSQQPDEGLSAEERRMLDALSRGGAPEAPRSAEAPQPAAAKPVARPDAGNLSSEEARVLAQAREETERLSRAELERMFQSSDDASAEPSPGLEALLARAAEAEAAAAPEPTAFEKSRFGRALAATLDFLNAPFRWLPRSYRLGLGLCGALLLLTLLLVILVKALRS